MTQANQRDREHGSFEKTAGHDKKNIEISSRDWGRPGNIRGFSSGLIDHGEARRWGRGAGWRDRESRAVIRDPPPPHDNKGGAAGTSANFPSDTRKNLRDHLGGPEGPAGARRSGKKNKAGGRKGRAENKSASPKNTSAGIGPAPERGLAESGGEPRGAEKADGPPEKKNWLGGARTGSIPASARNLFESRAGLPSRPHKRWRIGMSGGSRWNRQAVGKKKPGVGHQAPPRGNPGSRPKGSHIRA